MNLMRLFYQFLVCMVREVNTRSIYDKNRIMKMMTGGVQ
jgi:hypothetical protein